MIQSRGLPTANPITSVYAEISNRNQESFAPQTEICKETCALASTRVFPGSSAEVSKQPEALPSSNNDLLMARIQKRTEASGAERDLAKTARNRLTAERIIVISIFACVCLAMYGVGVISMSYMRGQAVGDKQKGCIVETCNSDWTSVSNLVNVNQDNAGCSSLRSMMKMSEYTANATGHFCKAYRAVQACKSKRYSEFIFRDDDTKLDIGVLLYIARRARAEVVASYKLDDKRIITNWFFFNTKSELTCRKMEQWWSSAQFDHPEHDQKYFNRIFTCGKEGVYCLDKRINEVKEVHCRSSLGPYRSLKRQDCMRYQIKPRPDLI